MTALVSAIPIIAQQTGRPVVLVGGLAVMCRLSTAYRATTDLDTVDRRGGGQVGQLELLLAAGAESSGPSGAMVETPSGLVQVDVLQVTDADMTHLPDDETDGSTYSPTTGPQPPRHRCSSVLTGWTRWRSLWPSRARSLP